MVAVLVAVSINRVGILIINSMLILPAASARTLQKAEGYQLLSVLISVFQHCVCGLFYANTRRSHHYFLYVRHILHYLVLGAPKEIG